MGSQKKDMPSEPSSKWAWRLVASYSQCHNAMSRLCPGSACLGDAQLRRGWESLQGL